MSITMSSIVVQGYNNTQNTINNLQRQLTTNQRDMSASETGIVTRISSQIASYDAASNNIDNAKSVLSVTTTGLSSISKLIQSMQDLANRANSTTLSTSDAAALQATFAELSNQVSDLANSSEVNGSNLLGASGSNLEVSVGLNSSDTVTINATASDSASLGIDQLDISSQSGAQSAITALKTALSTISSTQSTISAAKTGLVSRQDTINSISTNLQENVDRISKPDAAKLQQKLAELSNNQQISLWTLNQINSASQATLKLFQ